MAMLTSKDPNSRSGANSVAFGSPYVDGRRPSLATESAANDSKRRATVSTDFLECKSELMYLAVRMVTVAVPR